MQPKGKPTTNCKKFETTWRDEPKGALSSHFSENIIEKPRKLFFSKPDITCHTVTPMLN
jgi:hypothetical protein